MILTFYNNSSSRNFKWVAGSFVIGVIAGMMKSYVKLLNEALQKDSRIFLVGEDIGEYGGCFGASKGLLKKYGSSRVVDTPMSEQTIVGLG